MKMRCEINNALSYLMDFGNTIEKASQHQGYTVFEIFHYAGLPTPLEKKCVLFLQTFRTSYLHFPKHNPIMTVVTGGKLEAVCCRTS